MKSFAKALLIATLGLTAAGTALADSATISGNTASQNQSGSRNRQDMEVGVVDLSAFGSGTARVSGNTFRQTQSGTDNRQSMLVGKIDKNFGTHQVVVTGNNFSQAQSGSRNVQRMKIGVVE